MFQFASLTSLSYIFRQRYLRFSLGGFPHSEISGSKLDWQLPEAYSSLLLPSSPPDTKASTKCPFQLSTNLQVSCYKTLNCSEFVSNHKYFKEHNFLKLILKPIINTQATKKLVEVSGFEPLAFRVQDGCSTN